MAKLTREQVLAISRMRREKREDGHLKTNKDIAHELGVTETTVIRWIQKLRKSGRHVPKRKAGVRPVNL